MNKYLRAFIAVIPVFLFTACSSPESSGCINYLDCGGEGFQCIEGLCVENTDIDRFSAIDDILAGEADELTAEVDETVSESENTDTDTTAADGIETEKDQDVSAGEVDNIKNDGLNDESKDSDTSVDLKPDSDDILNICNTSGWDCKSHGTCQDISGTPICKCDTGYSGDHCEKCATGYQDKDKNGTCSVDCANAGLTCTSGQCDDSTGLAKCVCTGGTQDNDGNGTCTPDCNHAAIDCTNGTCSDLTGTAKCNCNPNYQDNDKNGTCEKTCAISPACTNGSCDDSSGKPLCSCNSGYQDNDKNSTCEPNCATAGLSCTTHTICKDTTGTALCACNTGYTGASCDQCDTGYHLSGSDCVANIPCQANSCSNHGNCDASTGVPVCTCSTGYTGATCNGCASGYQDKDGDGTCKTACDSLCGSSIISSMGHCGADTGDPGAEKCICDAGYGNSFIGGLPCTCTPVDGITCRN